MSKKIDFLNVRREAFVLPEGTQLPRAEKGKRLTFVESLGLGGVKDLKPLSFPLVGERTPFYLDEKGEVLQPYHQCAWCKAITMNGEVVAKTGGKHYRGSHGICRGCAEVQNRIIERRKERVLC